jgi:hypothetical protein
MPYNRREKYISRYWTNLIEHYHIVVNIKLNYIPSKLVKEVVFEQDLGQTLRI